MIFDLDAYMEKHGETKFYWEGNLLIVEPKGPFNEEGQTYACNQIKLAILDSGIKRWRRLEILDEKTMGSLAVLDIVKDLYTWYDQNGCYITAVVVKNSLQAHSVAEVFNSPTVKIFISLVDAINWISQQ